MSVDIWLIKPFCAEPTLAMANYAGAKAAAAAKDEKKAKQDSQKNAQVDTDKKSTCDHKYCYTCKQWLNGSKQMVHHKQGEKRTLNWLSLNGFRFL